MVGRWNSLGRILFFPGLFSCFAEYCPFCKFLQLALCFALVIDYMFSQVHVTIFIVCVPPPVLAKTPGSLQSGVFSSKFSYHIQLFDLAELSKNGKNFQAFLKRLFSFSLHLRRFRRARKNQSE